MSDEFTQSIISEMSDPKIKVTKYEKFKKALFLNLRF